MSGRPEKNTVDYYPHLIGNGKKMYYIEQKYKNDGYATWHKILELLCDTEFHYLDLKDPITAMHVAAKCGVEENLLFQIIDDLERLNEIHSELWLKHRIIWNQKFRDGIARAYKDRKNPCIDITGLAKMLNIQLNDKNTPVNQFPDSKTELTSSEDTGNIGTKLNNTKLNNIDPAQFKIGADKKPVLTKDFLITTGNHLIDLHIQNPDNELVNARKRKQMTFIQSVYIETRFNGEAPWKDYLVKQENYPPSKNKWKTVYNMLRDWMNDDAKDHPEKQMLRSVKEMKFALIAKYGQESAAMMWREKLEKMVVTKPTKGKSYGSEVQTTDN